MRSRTRNARTRLQAKENVGHSLRGLLDQQVIWRPVSSLRPYPDNARHHSQNQIEALARSIEKFGWGRPLGIDEHGTILFGHGCLEAARHLALGKVPTLTISGLSEADKRAFVIADNRLAEKSDWNIELLKCNFQELTKIEFNVESTGFTTGEIDIFLDDTPEKHQANPDDDLGGTDGPAVSRIDDLWNLGSHRIYCGDSREVGSHRALLGSDTAQMVVTDAPYNVKIQGHARGRSRRNHREFAMASGEMSDAKFTSFLQAAIDRAIEFSDDGSIHYWFMDWRHLPQLLRAAAPYREWKNLLVWRKSNAGQGSFYRSQHELIAVFKSGRAPHINNFGLGSEGRFRTNVLDYPGGSSPDPKRQEELAMHPTVKPVALIADLIRNARARSSPEVAIKIHDDHRATESDAIVYRLRTVLR